MKIPLTIIVYKTNLNGRQDDYLGGKCPRAFIRGGICPGGRVGECWGQMSYLLHANIRLLSSVGVSGVRHSKPQETLQPHIVKSSDEDWPKKVQSCGLLSMQ